MKTHLLVKEIQNWISKRVTRNEHPARNCGTSREFYYFCLCRDLVFQSLTTPPKREPMRKLIYLLSLLAVLGSCVPQKQYVELKQENERLTQMLGLSDSLVGGNDLDTDARTELQNDYSELLLANERLRATNRNLNQSYQELLERYTTMIEQSKGLIDEQSGNTTTNQREQYLQELEAQIQQREQRLRSMESSYSQDITQKDQQIIELQNALFQRDQELQRMRNAFSSVQANFPATDLDVTERDGRLYVSLSQELLFRTGSARIDRSGRQAIQQIADALASLPGIEIMVEGHTDNQGDPGTNWELSLERALAVAKTLQDNGIRPEDIIVSGRGEHAPRASNASEYGRAQNRRTEIILSPQTEVGTDQ